MKVRNPYGHSIWHPVFGTLAPGEEREVNCPPEAVSEDLRADGNLHSTGSESGADTLPDLRGRKRAK